MTKDYGYVIQRKRGRGHPWVIWDGIIPRMHDARRVMAIRKKEHPTCKFRIIKKKYGKHFGECQIL